MMLSVVVPAHNEEGAIAGTLRALHATLVQERISHEIVVVNDNSTDRTEAVLHELAAEIPSLRWVNSRPPNGFGFAVRRGLDHFSGEAVAIYMADGSDS